MFDPLVMSTTTQEVQVDQTNCPLLGSGILKTWIILKTSHFVWSWTSRDYDYVITVKVPSTSVSMTLG